MYMIQFPVRAIQGMERVEEKGQDSRSVDSLRYTPCF